ITATAMKVGSVRRCMVLGNRRGAGIRAEKPARRQTRLCMRATSSPFPEGGGMTAGAACKTPVPASPCAWEVDMDARARRYHEVYPSWQRARAAFWAAAAAEIDWYEPAKQVFDPGAGVYGRWFPGAVCNTCFNAVDRHVLGGRAHQPAIIYDSPVTGV